MQMYAGGYSPGFAVGFNGWVMAVFVGVYGDAILRPVEPRVCSSRLASEVTSGGCRLATVVSGIGL